ncbi:hypothetical protein E4T56_gene19239 [Termitomyces sp. T112]|nr:hypothetical protein E4T56_gene19239 [Termitomyces sp. T112]
MILYSLEERHLLLLQGPKPKVSATWESRENSGSGGGPMILFCYTQIRTSIDACSKRRRVEPFHEMSLRERTHS